MIDLCSFKCICDIVTKEGRDMASVDMLGLFLQTEHKGEDLTTLKLTGDTALLLVESDPEK